MNFNGYSLFNEIRNPILRSYNRANTYMNIKERHGNEVAKKYLKKFGRNDILGIHSVMAVIHRDGYEQTRRNLIRTGSI